MNAVREQEVKAEAEAKKKEEEAEMEKHLREKIELEDLWKLKVQWVDLGHLSPSHAAAALIVPSHAAQHHHPSYPPIQQYFSSYPYPMPPPFPYSILHNAISKPSAAAVPFSHVAANAPGAKPKPAFHTSDHHEHRTALRPALPLPLQAHFLI